MTEKTLTRVHTQSFDLFIRELDNLIDTLNIRAGGFFILGQSWGGVLGAQYAMGQPQGLKKLVICSGPADISLYAKGLKGLLQRLPEDVRKTLEDCDRKGDHESEEFQKAAKVVGRNFISRLDPLPEEVQAGYKNLKDDPTVYVTMIVGSIKGYQGWKEAHKIGVETLLINGKNDSVTDLAMYPWFKTIPKVRWVTLNGAHHSRTCSCPCFSEGCRVRFHVCKPSEGQNLLTLGLDADWEDRERYMQEVGDFLASTAPGDRKVL